MGKHNIWLDNTKEGTDLLRWIWAYSEQIHLFDRHDALWIQCAELGWEGTDGEEEFSRFLTAYGLRRGGIGNYLKKDEHRKEIISICNGEFKARLSGDHFVDAQDRWNSVVEKLMAKTKATPASLALKTFWFYHPEKLPMYDNNVRNALSRILKKKGILKEKIEPNNFLLHFATYLPTVEADVRKAEQYFNRKYLSIPRVVDKYLWLLGSNQEENILEKFRSALKKIPLK